jgi:VanZ family protein
VSTTGPWYYRTVRSLTAIYWSGIFILTHLPPAGLPPVRVSDRLAHFMVYLLLSVLLWASLWSGRRAVGRLGATVIGTALLYGALDELTQPLVGRFASLDDWLADAGGVLVGVLVMSIVAGLMHVLRRDQTQQA